MCVYNKILINQSINCLVGGVDKKIHQCCKIIRLFFETLRVISVSGVCGKSIKRANLPFLVGLGRLKVFDKAKCKVILNTVCYPHR